MEKIYIPLINVFEPSYEIWNNDYSEIDKLIAKRENRILPERQLMKIINNHFAAAEHMLEVGMDNKLEFHVERNLKLSTGMQVWSGLTPSEVPEPLSEYKTSYPQYDIEKVDEAINSLNVYLSEGQTLFHGGIFDDFGQYPTNKPLSASFCPQVALRNAEWKGKAFERGQIDIFVLKVKSPSSKIFIYDLEGELGNEKEILFASGANLKFIKRTKVRDDYKVTKINSYAHSYEKNIPVYIVEAEIS